MARCLIGILVVAAAAVGLVVAASDLDAETTRSVRAADARTDVALRSGGVLHGCGREDARRVARDTTADDRVGTTAAPSTGRIAFRLRALVESETDGPLSHASVRVCGETTPAVTLAEGTTGAEGRITLDVPDVPEGERGTFSWEVRAPGHALYDERLPVPDVDGLVRTSAWMRRGMRIHGRVVDADGRGLGGLEVRCNDPVGDSVTSRDDGTFDELFAKPVADDAPIVRVEVSAFRILHTSTLVRVPPGATDVDVVLSWPPEGDLREVRGTVRLPTGAPAAGARIRYVGRFHDAVVLGDLPPDAPHAGSCVADARGAFRMLVPVTSRGCCTVVGVGEVVASLPGFADAVAALPEGSCPVSVRLALAERGTLTGIVVGDDGAPWEGARVSCRASLPSDAPEGRCSPAAPGARSGGYLYAEAFTGRDGRFEIEAPAGVPVVVRGDYGYRTMNGGHRDWSAWTTTTAGAGDVRLQVDCGRDDFPWSRDADDAPPPPPACVRPRFVDSRGVEVPAGAFLFSFSNAEASCGGAGIRNPSDSTISLPPGANEVTLSGEDIGRVSLRVVARPGPDPTDVVVPLPGGGTVRARIALPAGLDDEDVVLRLRRVDEPKSVRVFRLASGVRSAERVEPGRWIPEVEVLGDADWTIDRPTALAVERDGVANLLLCLTHGTSVEVSTGVAPDGVELPDRARLVLAVHDAEGVLRGVRDAEFDDTVTWHLAPGSYRFVLSFAGEPLADATVQVSTEPPEDVRVAPIAR